MRKIILASALCIAVIYSNHSTAQTTPEIRERQVNQEKRIHEGVKTDELSRGEAARLQARESKIQADKRAAKADGVVTPAEKSHIAREQNRTSRAIYRDKHNALVRHR